MATLNVLIGIGATLIVWYAIVLILISASRARTLVAAAATMHLRPEPPAVVNLLVTGGVMTQAAADATLIDLAARRVLDLHQPGHRPEDLLIRVRTSEPTGLTAYERRVFDRVGTADRFVPLAQIARRFADGGPHWFAGLRAEVIDDATNRGLVQVRKLGSATILACLLTGMMIACLGSLRLQRPSDGALTNTVNGAAVLGWFCAAPVIALVLVLVAQAHVRTVRLTSSGAGIGAYWLGVGSWLSAHPALADLPPEAVAVWDRYLAYGLALGVNLVADASLDLRTGRTGRFLSMTGGVPRTLDVRYPRSPFVYTQAGLTALWAASMATVWAAIGWWLADTHWRWTLPVIGLLILRWLYRAVRGLAAKLAPATITGRILATHPHRPRSHLEYRWIEFVLDDGVSRRTRPWLIRSDRAGSVRPGVLVRLRGQAWNRYALSVEPVADPITSPVAR